ncbi:hypothetical protein SAMN04488021_10969 [Paracoccus aminovorans]|uniref:Hemolysin-type calcium-binding repeat-containing protein n=1 Tax=Paracoccus aminovorans TaxID=34004 RepID=A0A1I2ZLN0_9RHOB|nr:calcium-binding protein [Paracoccus aminovorans]CQR85101.1 hypothetical protein JCM7685_0517 [Paracoccus aminovorans]SFH38723.1 hypothetical protein SAMN04488021_10969 [Paracoccus aminovorans]
MNDWLLLLVPLGAAAFAQLFDDDDDAHGGDATPPPAGTPGDDDLVIDDGNGVTDGGAGDDTLTATRNGGEALVVDYHDGNACWRENIHRDGSADWDWHSAEPYPDGGPDLGVTALRGGAGNDSIIATGPAMDLDGGAGDDTISLHSDRALDDSGLRHGHGVARGGAGDDVISVTGHNLIADGGDGNDSLSLAGDRSTGWGGAGDDRITGSGSRIEVAGGTGRDTISLEGSGNRLDGGEGDDSLTLTGINDGAYGAVYGGSGADHIRVSGSGMVVSGGSGIDVSDGAADTLDIAGLTDSELYLDGEDVLLDHGDDNTGLTFYLTGGHGLQGNASDERVYLRDAGRVDAGAGNDTLTVDVGRSAFDVVDGATLAGGAGNDMLRGAYGPADSGIGSGEDGYSLRIGNSNDVLDGGEGDDVIRFDLSDTVTGGAGADSLTGFADSGHHAVVTDFARGEDRLHVYLNPEDIMPDSPRNGPDDYSNVSVQESGGDTVIRLNAAEAVTVQNATGMNIGLRHDGAFGGESTWTDLNGNPVDPDDLDVTLDLYR